VLLRHTVCHCLHCHASQFIGQSTSQFIAQSTSQFIAQSTSPTAICHAILRRFVNVSRRFEWSQSHHLLGQLVKEGAHYKGWNPYDTSCEPTARVPKMTRGNISLARGIHCSLNFCNSFCPTSVSILWRICIYEHIVFKDKLQNCSFNRLQ